MLLGSEIERWKLTGSMSSVLTVGSVLQDPTWRNPAAESRSCRRDMPDQPKFEEDMAAAVQSAISSEERSDGIIPPVASTIQCITLDDGINLILGPSLSWPSATAAIAQITTDGEARHLCQVDAARQTACSRKRRRYLGEGSELV